jgi:hypothetical protein
MRLLLLSATLAGALFGAIALPAARATESDAGPSGDVAGLPLLDLRGNYVPVRYSAGSLQRATQIQDPFELLVADFRRWSHTPARLAVLLLSRDEWQESGLTMPYGMPMRMPGSNVATAAWGDAETVALWSRLLGGDLPAVEDSPLRSTAGESASLVAADLLALFEGARLMVEDAGYAGAEPWIGDVVAHTVAATVIARGFAGGVADARRVYRNLGATRTTPLPLTAYRAGLQLDDWLWFQSRFFEAALAILDAEKRGAGKSIVKLAKGSGGPLPASALVDRYPALRRWLVESFAPAGQ